MRSLSVFTFLAVILLATASFGEEAAAAPTPPEPAPAFEKAAPALPTSGQMPLEQNIEPTPAAPTAEPIPAEAKSEPEQAGEEKEKPIEEKKPETTAVEPSSPDKKEEKPAAAPSEIVRPYFGVAIASGVFGLLAIASGFYFDYLAKKSFDKYQEMATPEAIREAAKKPGFTPDEYVRSVKTKYDEGHQHIGSRNYAFIGGAIFIAAGIGLYFWTEEKKPDGEKKEEPISDKKVSLCTDGGRVTLNVSGSF